MTEKESLTGIAQQMTEQTKGAMENYFSWLQFASKPDLANLQPMLSV